MLERAEFTTRILGCQGLKTQNADASRSHRRGRQTDQTSFWSSGLCEPLAFLVIRSFRAGNYGRDCFALTIYHCHTEIVKGIKIGVSRGDLCKPPVGQTSFDLRAESAYTANRLMEEYRPMSGYGNTSKLLEFTYS